MKNKGQNTFLYLIITSFLTLYSDNVMSASKNIKRKASSGSKISRKSTNKRLVSTTSSDVKNTVEKNTKEQDVADANDTITEDNCEFNYNLCMNKICADNSIGKCVCYEDKYTNTTPTFKTINGNRVKQGFELFEYAKKQCVSILDKCMQTRRSITEKYKNFVQRDCLMLSEVEVAKNQGLSGELDELKKCLYNYCTASDINGAENFSMPKYGLCFDPDVAKYQLDANCISIIAKSAQPKGLRELFMNEMAKYREEACSKMNGEISSDRQKCYINVSYGINKDDISGTKKIAVGDFFNCNGKEFDTKLGETEEYKRLKRHQAANVVSTGFRTAGNIVGIVVGESAAGFIVDKTIDLGGSIANIAIDVNKMQEGKLSKEAMKEYVLNELGLPSVITMAISRSIAGVATSATNTAGEAIKSVASAGGGCAFEKASSKAAAGNKKYQNAGKALGIAAEVVKFGGTIAGTVMDSAISDMNKEDEEKGIVKHATIDRNAGVGEANNTATVRGNCFINGEWFATENETILLEWQI